MLGGGVLGEGGIEGEPSGMVDPVVPSGMVDPVVPSGMVDPMVCPVGGDRSGRGSAGGGVATGGSGTGAAGVVFPA